VTGDFNSDGKTDLIVGAYGYKSNQGRTYLYTFNDGVITGEATSNYFGVSLASGDFNARRYNRPRRRCLGFSANTGRAYIFYNDGSYPTGAASADVIIQGETGLRFGASLTAGDFNADGKTDLAVGARGYSTSTGRAYIFYNDGSYPTGLPLAPMSSSRERQDQDRFGAFSLPVTSTRTARPTLPSVRNSIPPNTGRVYIFYNDGTYPTAAASADSIIQGKRRRCLFWYLTRRR
jgi:hypothetical protein